MKDTRASGVAVVAAAIIGAACGGSEPRTDAERLARGRQIIETMSAKLAAAKTFTVTTVEQRDEITATGKTRPVSLTRETTIRRPDRLYSKVTGDHDNEVWYDGIGVTLVLHKDKVFAQTRAPETLDKTMDALYERYGIHAPFADYVHSAPAKALLSDKTTGGWVGRETINGKATDHLAFKDTGVAWEVWVASDRDPLPVRAKGEFTNRKVVSKLDLTFKDWNFSPAAGDDRFKPNVPADYEGIAMIQRARVLKNVKDEAAGAGANK